MKKTLIFIFIFYISMFGYGKIPMKEVIRRGILKNYRMMNNSIEKKILETEKKIFNNDKFFNIDFSGLYLYKSEQAEIKMPDLNPAPGIIIPGVHMLAGTKHIFDFNLSVKQPIYTGGILSSKVKLNTIKSLQNEYKRILLENSIEAAIKTCYLNYEFHILQKKYLELIKRDLKNHLLKLDEYFKEELVKKSDILETELKLEEIKINIHDIDNRIAKYETEFKELTGVRIKEVNEKFTEDILNYKDSFDYLKNNHPIIKNIDKSIRMLEIKKRMEKGKYLPQISGFGEIHYGKPGIDFFKDNWSLYFQGGINISLKVFEWGKLKKTERIFNYSMEKLANQKREYIDKSKENLKNLFFLKKIIEKKINIAEKLLKISAENSELMEKLFKEKQKDNMEYISSLLKKESYSFLKKQLLIKLEIVKVNINQVIGRK